MIEVTKTTYPQMEKLAADAGIPLPIEQTEAWAHYQNTIDGRQPIGAFVISEDGNAIAVVSLIDFDTHGFHFARATHGPVYFRTPDAETEQRVVNALSDYARHHLRAVKFLRIAIDAEGLEGVVPVLSTVPYNLTVIMDLTGGDEAILKRMTHDGRKAVRRTLRRCPAICADETDEALESFDDYYDVMVETGARDGFHPSPKSDYENALRVLGPEHARLFAARLGEKVEAWSIITINDGLCVRYWGGMRTEAMPMNVTDKLLYTEACTLGSMGYERFDLMGIGSDFAPSLMGLNQFKKKFTNNVTTPVAPERDVPVHKAFYNMLLLAKRLRSHDAGEAAQDEKKEDTTPQAAPQPAESGTPAPGAATPEKRGKDDAKETGRKPAGKPSKAAAGDAPAEKKPEETGAGSSQKEAAAERPAGGSLLGGHVLTQVEPEDDEPINDPDLIDRDDEDDYRYDDGDDLDNYGYEHE